MRNRCFFALLIGAALAVAAVAQNKDSFTPMAQDSGFGPVDLSAPAIAPEEIIRRFAAKESEFQQALSHYTYRRAARVQTLDEDNQVDGEWYEVDEVLFDSAGRRAEKTVYAPASTLQRIQLTPADMQEIQSGDFFVLTMENTGQYNLKYVGQQKVDEIDCYVFDVSPKVIDKKQHGFSGRIWVDANGLQIVVTNGRMEAGGARTHKKDPRPLFMTWRQQVEGGYWFPAYTRCEGLLRFSAGKGRVTHNVHLREIIRYTDYKRSSQ